MWVCSRSAALEKVFAYASRLHRWCSLRWMVGGLERWLYARRCDVDPAFLQPFKFLIHLGAKTGFDPHHPTFTKNLLCFCVLVRCHATFPPAFEALVWRNAKSARWLEQPWLLGTVKRHSVFCFFNRCIIFVLYNVCFLFVCFFQWPCLFVDVF